MGCCVAAEGSTLTRYAYVSTVGLKKQEIAGHVTFTDIITH
jgi:hypothetical protein